MNANRVVQRQGSGGLATCRAWVARVAALAALVMAGTVLAQTPNSIEQVSVTRGAAVATMAIYSAVPVGTGLRVRS